MDFEHYLIDLEFINPYSMLELTRIDEKYLTPIKSPKRKNIRPNLSYLKKNLNNVIEAIGT